MNHLAAVGERRKGCTRGLSRVFVYPSEYAEDNGVRFACCWLPLK